MSTLRIEIEVRECRRDLGAGKSGYLVIMVDSNGDTVAVTVPADALVDQVTIMVGDAVKPLVRAAAA
jgi:hypothetical protein